MKSAGIFGWPVQHSKSPVIHRFWLAALGLDGDYGRFPVHPDLAAAAFAALPALGLSGVNITAPHKIAALAAADRAEPSATRAGSANILSVEAGRLVAANSDGAGFIEPLQRRNLRPESAIVLGAGGAARAVVLALADLGVRRLTLVNRSADKASLLARLWPDAEVTILPFTPDALLPPADLIVNASSLGMTGQPPLTVRLDAQQAHAIVYDLVYAPLETALLKAAGNQRLTTIDGLEMLVAQADPAFRRFFDATPPRTRDAELRALLTAP